MPLLQNALECDTELRLGSRVRFESGGASQERNRACERTFRDGRNNHRHLWFQTRSFFFLFCLELHYKSLLLDFIAIFTNQKLGSKHFERIQLAWLKQDNLASSQFSFLSNVFFAFFLSRLLSNARFFVLKKNHSSVQFFFKNVVRA
jgi:hypothetical protein